MLTPRQLGQYAKVCQKYGITELSIDGNSFKIAPLEQPPVEQASSPIPDPLTKEPSEDEILFWSSSPAQIE